MTSKKLNSEDSTFNSAAVEQIAFLAKRLEGNVLSTLIIVAPYSIIDGPHRLAVIESLLQRHLVTDHKQSSLQ